jgi:radical SAM superfamily enzyme YgiQ (UPF0313 family)
MALLDPDRRRALLAYTSGQELADDYFACMIPVGLGILNAVLNARGFHSEVGNFSRYDRERLTNILEETRPDVLGLSVFTFNRHASHELAALYKRIRPDGLAIAGGPHVTHLDRQWLEHYPQFDAVVRGEGEQTLIELLERQLAGQPLSGTLGSTVRDSSGGICVAPERPTITDLDQLPHNAAHLHRSIGVNVGQQLRYFISSRGCPGACTFCNTPLFWGKRVRFRSVQDVMSEFRTIRERHGLIYLSIRDDTFTAHRPRTIELCKELIDSRLYFMWDCQSRVNLVDEERLEWMKRAGCHHVQYGIESGSERILQILQKDIKLEQIRKAVSLTRAAGLVVSIYLISGVPEERPEDIEATCALIREVLPHDGIVAPLAFYPGTKLYDSSARFLGADDSIWLTDPRHAIWVREDDEAQRHHRQIEAQLAATGRKAAFRPDDFQHFEQRLGWLFTTELQRSEYWRRQGDYDQARACAEVIVERQPDNPWGYLRLAELHQELGEDHRARTYRDKARNLVPRLAA